MKIRRDGFTLYELLLVIVVIGILSAILFPVMMRARIKSYETTASSDIGQLTAAIRMYAEDWGTYPPDATVYGSGYDCGVLMRALEHGKDASGRGEYIEYPVSRKNGTSPDSDLLDPWGKPYQYKMTATLVGKVSYNLWSMGKNKGDNTHDSVPPDDDYVDDIGNW